MKDRIKKLRKEKGISQAQLGEILNISQRSIGFIETGHCKPTIEQIEKMSKFFEVSADYLLFGRENIEPIEYEILKVIRDDKTLLGALIKMLESKKTVYEEIDGLAA